MLPSSDARRLLSSVEGQPPGRQDHRQRPASEEALHTPSGHHGQPPAAHGPEHHTDREAAQVGSQVRMGIGAEQTEQREPRGERQPGAPAPPPRPPRAREGEAAQQPAPATTMSDAPRPPPSVRHTAVARKAPAVAFATRCDRSACSVSAVTLRQSSPERMRPASALPARNAAPPSARGPVAAYASTRAAAITSPANLPPPWSGAGGGSGASSPSASKSASAGSPSHGS